MANLRISRRQALISTAAFAGALAMPRLGRAASEAVAQGDGPALGLELDTADLLSVIKHEAIPNTVWLTAGAHYTAAHHHSPTARSVTILSPFGNLFPVRCTQPHLAPRIWKKILP